MQCRVTKGKFVDRVSIRAKSCEKPGSSRTLASLRESGLGRVKRWADGVYVSGHGRLRFPKHLVVRS